MPELRLTKKAIELLPNPKIGDSRMEHREEATERDLILERQLWMESICKRFNKSYHV
jgi:hypothetical protein